jgi:hypothetical protein
MTTVAKTFSAVNTASDPLFLRKGQSAAFVITGTFEATLHLQRTRNGGQTWETVQAFETTASSTVIQPEDQEARWRFFCPAYTSGSPAITLADQVDALQVVRNQDGTPVLTINDEGIETPKATVASLTALVAIMSGLLNLTAIENALTAFAGGGKASALALDATKTVHRVTTVGTAADSVLMPPATVGAVHIVENAAAANAMQVFGAGTDTINLVATATGVSQAAGKTAIYVCIVAGNWSRLLSA